MFSKQVAKMAKQAKVLAKKKFYQASPSQSVRCSLSLDSDILEELRDHKVDTQHRTVESKFLCAAEIATHEDSKQTQPSVVKIVFYNVPSSISMIIASNQHPESKHQIRNY